VNGSEYVCDPFEVVGHYREADFRIMKLLLTSGGISNRSIHNNRPSYIAGELAEWIGAQGMSHARGAPFDPQTQGKIARWHQTLKNRALLENYFLPGDLERQIEAFIEHYNHRRTLHSPGHG
jgi:transposase InsO family protein